MLPAVDRQLVCAELWSKNHGDCLNEDDNNEISRYYATIEVMEDNFGAAGDNDMAYNYVPDSTMDGDNDDDNDDSSYDYAPAA